MAYIKAFVVLAALAALSSAAEEPVRAKKDVYLASPYSLSYAYDDGTYYHGKYVAAPYAAVPAAVPAASVAVPAVTAYSAYPYAYSALPYRPVIV